MELTSKSSRRRRYRRREGACAPAAFWTATTTLLLFLSSCAPVVHSRLSSTRISRSSGYAPTSSTGTILTKEHLESIASFDPANPPQLPQQRQRKTQPQSSAADDAKCRPLQIDEWLNLLQTETDAEFDITEEVATTADVDPALLLARAQLMWIDNTKYEWDRAKRATDESSTPSPFVVCVERSEADRGAVGGGGSRLMSGFRRRKFIRDRIRDAITDMDGDEVYRQVIQRTLYNGNDMFCSYALMDATVAQNLDFDGCVVQPLLMAMKLMPRTVQLLLDKARECKDQMQNGDNRRQSGRDQAATVLDLLLGDDEEDGRNGVDARDKGSSVLDGLPDCDAINELDRPAADIILCPGSVSSNQLSSLQAGDTGVARDITSQMTSYLTSKTGSFADDNFGSHIAEEVYWTSTAADRYRRTESGRAEFWRQALEEAGTTQCDEVFETKLNWLVRPGADEGDFSVLRVIYDASTAKRWESGCVMSLVAGLAVRQDVCGLEMMADVGVNNYNANWMVQSGLQDEIPWSDVGLDGTGQIVALSDTGIDTSNCYFYDADFETPSENLNTNGHRKIAMYWPYADDRDEELGHGTHVGAIIAGNRAPDGIFEEPGVANGIAPAAKLAFIDISSTVGRLSPPSDNDVLSTGRDSNDNQKAHIHSMSWGSKNVFYYNNQARMYDNYMFNNDDFLVVVAAGNGGMNDRETSVGAPGNAKNILSVGASHTFGDDLERGQLGPSYIADFSSRGPTHDGRIAPDVVAPGKYILSAAARPNDPGACDPRNGEIPEAGEDRDGLYSQAGSSMSAPLVAGAAALIRQYFEEGWNGDGTKGSASAMSPSGALVKAILMNGAQADMNGVDNGRKGITTARPYDNNQGFGRVSLTDSLYIAGKTDVQFKFWDQETLFDGDPARTYEIEIDESRGCDTNKLSVTLAWVEEGSPSGCTKCLLNDLDLHITEDGRESIRYHPNGRSVKDDVNTVERIVIDGVNDGSRYTIHVDAYNLNSLSQNYALVATGCFGGIANQINTAQNVFAEDMTQRSGQGGGDGSNNTTMIIIIVCASCGGAIALCLGLALLRRCKQKETKKKKRKKAMPEKAPSAQDLTRFRRGTTG